MDLRRLDMHQRSLRFTVTGQQRLLEPAWFWATLSVCAIPDPSGVLPCATAPGVWLNIPTSRIDFIDHPE